MQSRDLLLVAARCSQKPEEQRYVLERVAERADYVGCSDPALSPCRFNPCAACFCARDATRRVTLRREELDALPSYFVLTPGAPPSANLTIQVTSAIPVKKAPVSFLVNGEKQKLYPKGTLRVP